LNVVPGYKQEAPYQAQMLEEAVGGHEALGRRHLPEPFGKEGRREREAAKGEGS
jgi:hypothetical protein